MACHRPSAPSPCTGCSPVWNNLLPVSMVVKPHSLLSSQLRCPVLQEILTHQVSWRWPFYVLSWDIVLILTKARMSLCTYVYLMADRQLPEGGMCTILIVEEPESGLHRSSRVGGRKQGRQSSSRQDGRWVASLSCCPAVCPSPPMTQASSEEEATITHTLKIKLALFF